jgi:hypothetical protein
VRKPTIRGDFKTFNFFVQQHETTKPTEINTIKYILFGLVCMVSIWFRMDMHDTQFLVSQT